MNIMLPNAKKLNNLSIEFNNNEPINDSFTDRNLDLFPTKRIIKDYSTLYEPSTVV